jgi:hypothetical protein
MGQSPNITATPGRVIKRLTTGQSFQEEAVGRRNVRSIPAKNRGVSLRLGPVGPLRFKHGGSGDPPLPDGRVRRLVLRERTLETSGGALQSALHWCCRGVIAELLRQPQIGQANPPAARNFSKPSAADRTHARLPRAYLGTLARLVQSRLRACGVVRESNPRRPD